LLPARQYPGEVAYRLLMLLVPDFGKVAGDLKLHALVQRDLPRTLFPVSWTPKMRQVAKVEPCP